MRTPAFLITGIEPITMAATAMGLAWDLSAPVTVTHAIDPASGFLTRTVSDLGGVVEHEEIELEHACVHCAIREDVVPTLARLAADGRWSSIVAVLPASADARQVCRLVGHTPDVAPALRIAGVLAALGGDDLGYDLTGDDLLADRELGIVEDDRRGVAEVLAGIVEYADLVSVATPTVPEGAEALTGGLAMVRALARPGAMVVTDWPGFDGAQLTEGIHAHDCSEEWVAEVRHCPLPEPHEGTWQLELTSERPLHPQRMLERIEDLGGGTFRSRGCFWLPTRPGWQCAWDGAGGQLSIGLGSRWGLHEQPLTRIVATGLLAHGDPRDRVRAAFEACLLTDDELAERGPAWEAWDDGLEPWLGAIHTAA